nr:type VI secretion system ATPase TssH [Oxalobacteraceae bacterium]
MVNFFDPVHLLAAMLNQEDGGTRSLMQRAGVNVAGLVNSIKSALERLPKVSGSAGEVQVGREMAALLNLSDKEAQKHGDQFIASEMVLLALCDDKSDA